MSRATRFGSEQPLIRLESLGVYSLGVYSLGVYCLVLPILDLDAHTLGVYTLGVYSLGVYCLTLPILDLGMYSSESNLWDLFSGGLLSGVLLSRATDFGSGIALTCP